MLLLILIFQRDVKENLDRLPKLATSTVLSRWLRSLNLAYKALRIPFVSIFCHCYKNLRFLGTVTITD
ncbi:hypothetical protein NIES2111_54370 [Nostoc sp. NIES-2111]|nr:hypothetical protein NIES2111_54370 [Nostoc sp. NIES-2111]